ncbi:MAG TPA: hypothetical protein VF180_04430, partial [Acidimicrobiia bacterium]
MTERAMFDVEALAAEMAALPDRRDFAFSAEVGRVAWIDESAVEWVDDDSPGRIGQHDAVLTVGRGLEQPGELLRGEFDDEHAGPARLAGQVDRQLVAGVVEAHDRQELRVGSAEAGEEAGLRGGQVGHGAGGAGPGGGVDVDGDDLESGGGGAAQ